MLRKTKFKVPVASKPKENIEQPKAANLGNEEMMEEKGSTTNTQVPFIS